MFAEGDIHVIHHVHTNSYPITSAQSNTQQREIHVAKDCKIMLFQDDGVIDPEILAALQSYTDTGAESPLQNPYRSPSPAPSHGSECDMSNLIQTLAAQNEEMDKFNQDLNECDDLIAKSALLARTDVDADLQIEISSHDLELEAELQRAIESEQERRQERRKERQTTLVADDCDFPQPTVNTRHSTDESNAANTGTEKSWSDCNTKSDDEVVLRQFERQIELQAVELAKEEAQHAEKMRRLEEAAAQERTRLAEIERRADEVREQKRHKACVLIQSWFRGHLVRRQWLPLITEHREQLRLLRQREVERQAALAEASRRHRAAIIIQSWFRGYSTRAHIELEAHKKELHEIVLENVNFESESLLDDTTRDTEKGLESTEDIVNEQIDTGTSESAKRECSDDEGVNDESSRNDFCCEISISAKHFSGPANDNEEGKHAVKDLSSSCATSDSGEIVDAEVQSKSKKQTDSIPDSTHDTKSSRQIEAGINLRRKAEAKLKADQDRKELELKRRLAEIAAREYQLKEARENENRKRIAAEEARKAAELAKLKEQRRREEEFMIMSLAASTIQDAWRRHKNRQLVTNVFAPAATMIQACWRGYWLRRRMGLVFSAAEFVDDDEFDYGEIDLAEFEIGTSLEIDSDLSLARNHRTFEAHAEPTATNSEVRVAWSEPREDGPRPPSRPRSSSVERRARNRQFISYQSSRNPKEECFGQFTSTADTVNKNTNSNVPRAREVKIREEWGFKDPKTASAMLKRARRLGHKKRPKKPAGSPPKYLSAAQSSRSSSVVSASPSHSGFQWVDEGQVVHRELGRSLNRSRGAPKLPEIAMNRKASPQRPGAKRSTIKLPNIHRFE